MNSGVNNKVSFRVSSRMDDGMVDDKPVREGQGAGREEKVHGCCYCWRPSCDWYLRWWRKRMDCWPLSIGGVVGSSVEVAREEQLEEVLGLALVLVLTLELALVPVSFPPYHHHILIAILVLALALVLDPSRALALAALRQWPLPWSQRVLCLVVRSPNLFATLRSFPPCCRCCYHYYYCY